jgi:hypothetical protein
MTYSLAGISKRHCQRQRPMLAEVAMLEVEEVTTNVAETKGEAVNNEVGHNSEGVEDLPEPAIILVIWGGEVDRVVELLQLRTRLFGSISCSISRRRVYFLLVSSSSPRSGARRMQMHSATRTSALPRRRVQST